MSNYQKGDGVFKERAGKIYVHGTINGKFYRKSTGKKATAINKAWIKKQDPLKILAELLGLNINGSNEIKTSIKEVAYEALEMQNEAKKMSEKHRKNKLRVVEKNILPFFEGIPFESISVRNIVSWINNLKENYSFTRVKFMKNLFKSIFNYAKNDLRIIDYNPFESETIKNIDLSWTATTDTYTTKEISLILNESIGWFKIYLDIAIKYGLRPAEIIVLKWDDIDFDNGLLYLQRSKNVDNEIIEHKKVVGNKNHFRTIPLFDSTIELLKNYETVKSNKEWLFVNKDNKTYTNSQSVVDFHLKPLLSELNIEYKTLYALRRSFASIMNFAGQDLESIQKVMGHSEGSSVTEKHYITEDILTIQDRKNQSKKSEQLFNTLIKSEV